MVALFSDLVYHQREWEQDIVYCATSFSAMSPVRSLTILITAGYGKTDEFRISFCQFFCYCAAELRQASYN